MSNAITYRQIGPTRRVGETASGAIDWFSVQTQCVGCGDYFPEHEHDADGTGRTLLRYTVTDRAFCGECVERGGGFAPTVKRAAVKLDVDVPPMYAAARLSQFRPVIRDVLLKWPREYPLVFGVGPTGHGKSHAGWALVNRAASSGFLVQHGYCNEVKAKWAAKEPRERDMYGERFKRAAYLVLDDLTSAAVSDGWGAFLHELLDSRMREARPTVLLSTASVEDVRTLLGDSIGSRLKQFEWLDFRPNGDRRAKVPVSASERESA